MRIVLFGGNGFIGSHLAAELSRRGHSLVIPARNRERVKDNLILLPQTNVIGYLPTKPSSIAKMLNGADVAVNLVGALNEQGFGGKFDQVHGEFTRLISEGAKSRGIHRFIQISSIGATNNAPSNYLRSKAKAERIVSANESFHHVIIRLSVVFGEGDKFINQFASILRYFPVVPLPCARAKMQPISVEDVVRIIVCAIEDDAVINTTWYAGGPETLSLYEIVGKIATTMRLRRQILPLGDSLSSIAATVADLMPFVRTFSRDNYLSTKTPSVCPKNENAASAKIGELRSLDASLQKMLAEKGNWLGDFRSSARR